jgi:hypothetical protein
MSVLSTFLFHSRSKLIVAIRPKCTYPTLNVSEDFCVTLKRVSFLGSSLVISIKADHHIMLNLCKNPWENSVERKGSSFIIFMIIKMTFNYFQSDAPSNSLRHSKRRLQPQLFDGGKRSPHRILRGSPRHISHRKWLKSKSQSETSN